MNLKPEHILLQTLPSAIDNIRVEEKGIILNIQQQHIKLIGQVLKLSSLLNYNNLLDIWASDKLIPANKRFILYYMFLSHKRNSRIYIKSNVPTINALAKANSITPLFSSAGFLEREVWDLFGIFFISHPDLRRIVTDYGFKGFPLRKDFPVTGFREIKYDDKSAKLIYTPIDFAQSYRLYSYNNPWGGPNQRT